MDSDRILKLANEQEDEQIMIWNLNWPSGTPVGNCSETPKGLYYCSAGSPGVSGQFSSIQHYSATQYTQRTSLSTETVLTLIYTFTDG